MTTSEILLAEFWRLTDAEGGLDQLRRLVLDLALRGKLVEQKAGEGDAESLLDALKAALPSPTQSRRGRVRKHEDIPLPFQEPESWRVARLGDLLELVNGRAFKPSEWSEDGLPIIRIQNLNNSTAEFNRCALRVDEKFHVRDGDLLISWSGTPGTSFGAFVWDRGPALLNQHIFRAVIRASTLTPQFARLAVNARLETMIEQAHGGVGLRHITKGKLEAIMLPIPPLREQRRVVEKLEELMAMCDELESRLSRQQSLAQRFTESVVSTLTAG